jgi:phage terminase large subunit-like protein
VLRAGKLQPSDDCPDCDDWQTEGPHWLKAAPNLGVSISYQYQREQVAEAINIPSQRNMVRRLNFCQWTQQATVWIPVEKWAACKSAISSASLVGRECYIGIDLSAKIDMSSVVLIFPRPIEDESGLRGEAGGNPAVSELGSPSLDRAIDVLPYFWMPRNTLLRRAQEDNLPYVEWEKDGHITSTPGDIIDHDAMVDFVIRAKKLYSIKGIGFDQAGATAAVTRLRREFGDDHRARGAPEFPASLRTVQDARGARRQPEPLAQQQSGDADAHIGNMAIEENNWREIRPVKINQRKRIDGGVACIDAIKVMLATPYNPNVYMHRGVRTLGA